MSEMITLHPGKNKEEAVEVDVEHPLCQQSKLLKGLIDA